MTSIRLEQVSKTFGETVALAETNLAINPGELFFLLGPSGCGKTTLLRLIAGLYAPTTGRIFFTDREVTKLYTDRRNAVMVFQNYALWPHMSVRENVRFGLAVRKLGRTEQEQRIDEVLRLTHLNELTDRKPNQLSGGQQQRVALARALAVRPDCLLLDEPLSNLDAKLRQEMRSEIRHICKSHGLTSVYVTHDQKEALSIADRIAVMNAGRIVQVGTPGQLYHEPTNAFVADFIGESNLLSGAVIGQEDGVIVVDTPAGHIRAVGNRPISSRVTLSVRPEQLRRTTSPTTAPALNRMEGRVEETRFLGEASEHVLSVNGQKLKVISTPPLFEPPPQMTVEFDSKDAVVLPE